jgi:hypothetical protein
VTTNIPGYPVNFQAGLPFASTMTVQIPARTIVTDSRTNVIITAKRWNGQ